MAEEDAKTVCKFFNPVVLAPVFQAGRRGILRTLTRHHRTDRIWDAGRGPVNLSMVEIPGRKALEIHGIRPAVLAVLK